MLHPAVTFINIGIYQDIAIIIASFFTADDQIDPDIMNQGIRYMELEDILTACWGPDWRKSGDKLPFLVSMFEHAFPLLTLAKDPEITMSEWFGNLWEDQVDYALDDVDSAAKVIRETCPAEKLRQVPHYQFPDKFVQNRKQSDRLPPSRSGKASTSTAKFEIRDDPRSFNDMCDRKRQLRSSTSRAIV